MYNVSYLAIDNTGNGIAVADHVAVFFPHLTRLNYNPDLKTEMGLRTKELLQKQKLHFDSGLTVVAKSLLSIKKAVTAQGRNVTLVTTRSAQTGHGDLAWAIMNGLTKAPLIHTVGNTGRTTARIKVSS